MNLKLVLIKKESQDQKRNEKKTSHIELSKKDKTS